MSFQSYFNAEMRHLQQHLSDECSEHTPQTDRILEGVAYLTARIQQRLDHDFPEIPAQLLQEHWPHMLEPYASRMIVEFFSDTPKNIPQNTVIMSPVIGPEKTSCKFSTLSDLTVYPITLAKLDITDQKLKFYFENKSSSSRPEFLNVYLNTDIQTALELYYVLQAEHEIKSDSNVWLDYFNFREQFLFVTIKKLKFYENTKYFEAEINFKHPLPSGLVIKQECFKLNCVPVVNQYDLYSEPVVVHTEKLNYEICPDNHRPQSVVLQRIKNIFTRDHRSVNYAWDFAYSRLKIPEETVGVLSCEIEASNGHYPRQFISENSMHNLTRPSLYVSPPEQKYYLWEVSQLLDINFNKLDLKKMLGLFHWSENKSYQNHINSIQFFSLRPINIIKNGLFYQGSEFMITLQENNFKSLAEIYFLGCFFYAFFKSNTPINHLVQLKLELVPSGKIMLW